MDRLRFGPAGVPLSSSKRDTLSGIEETYKLGLDAMELEFVYGVKLKDEIAIEAKSLAKKYDIVLTAHAPYYINLNAKEEVKRKKSIQMLKDSIRALALAGGWSVVFHPGWYMNTTKEEAYRRVKESLKEVVNYAKEFSFKVWIRPETMEGEKKFGNFDEVIKLSQELEMVLPCIDFAHLRYRYKNNSTDFFRSILEKLENELGKEALKDMHIHMSGIKLDKAGTHLNLEVSDIPWREILKLLKEFGVRGVIISESPNIEGDAILMRDYWRSLQ